MYRWKRTLKSVKWSRFTEPFKGLVGQLLNKEDKDRLTAQDIINQIQDKFS